MAAKIMMLSALAGANYSYSHGEIVEVDEVTAAAWIKAGIASEAPSDKVAAEEIARLRAQVAGLSGEVVPLRQFRADAEAQAAGAKAERKGAEADRATLKKALDTAIAQAAELQTRLAATEVERDQALAQGKERGDRLAAALAAAPAK